MNEGEEVVVARRCLALLGPERGAAEVGTEGQYDGRLRHHRLVEVGRCQSLLGSSVAGDDDAIKLEVAHCGRLAGLLEQACEELVVHPLGGVSTDGSSVFDVHDYLDLIVLVPRGRARARLAMQS